jgi:hypothetical protein
MACLECKISCKGKEIWIQGFMLGKLSIPKSDNEFDEVLDIGKRCQGLSG